MKHKILLGLTGSVATVLHEKLVKEFVKVGSVSVIFTESSKHFIEDISGFEELVRSCGGKIYTEKDEWTFSSKPVTKRIDRTDLWSKGESVLHIKLRDEFSALVIAPCSANTLGKITNGLCDNLLTTVARAWDTNRPFIIAPAMNTHMWGHPLTEEQLDKFREFGHNNKVVPPQSKMLACGTKGMGAMANIEDIVKEVERSLEWFFPLGPLHCKGIPSTGHPGAFACPRKHEKHTGVDLYTDDDAKVYAVEDGMVVDRENFTGEWDNSPWWNNTECVLVEGPTGVVCYGEIMAREFMNPGFPVKRGDWIGNVKRVLKDGKERPDIMGHSCSMLHMELYPHGTIKSSNGFEEGFLNDPTPFLIKAAGAPNKMFTA